MTGELVGQPVQVGMPPEESLARESTGIFIASRCFGDGDFLAFEQSPEQMHEPRFG
jgi:hypothetical protein